MHRRAPQQHRKATLTPQNMGKMTETPQQKRKMDHTLQPGRKASFIPQHKGRDMQTPLQDRKNTHIPQQKEKMMTQAPLQKRTATFIPQQKDKMTQKITHVPQEKDEMTQTPQQDRKPTLIPQDKDTMSHTPQQAGKAPNLPLPSTSHSDSGYSSVLTSPEWSCGGHQGVTASGGMTGLTPEEAPGRHSARLTSTPHPHTTASQEGFRLPLPRIRSITRLGRSRYNSTSDSPITTAHTEMHELEMTCRETTKRVTRSAQTPQAPARTRVTGHRITTSRAITRLRKPQCAFVRLLKEADYLLHRVLRHLGGEDLLHLSHVNRQLRDMILQDKVVRGRREAFMRGRKTDKDRVGKENFKLKRLQEGTASSYPTLSPRKHLSSIQNLCGSNSNTTTTATTTAITITKSPMKVSPLPPLTQRFIEEGKNLATGQELQQCVKCRSPAVVQRAQQRATCSITSCGYTYCTNCHLACHLRPQDCPVMRPRTRQAAGIFSDRCKRNLRRL